MNSVVFSEKHVPCGYMGILGCNGYEAVDQIVCLMANGDNNFISEGIVENSILFVDTTGKFKPGALNVFSEQSRGVVSYVLSRNEMENADFFGRVLMSVNQY